MSTTNLRIKTGSYAGTGAAQTISGLGFIPQTVIVKGGANAAVWRTDTHPNDTCSYLATASADITTGITGFTDDGFVVSTGVTANENGTTYHYVAFRGMDAQTYFDHGYYVGNGENGMVPQIGTTNVPEAVFIKSASTVAGTISGNILPTETAISFGGLAHFVEAYPVLPGGEFQFGTVANVSAAGITHYFFTSRTLQGCIATGNYLGNGTARTITGLGFTPDLVLLKNYDSTDPSIFRTSSFSGDSSAPLTAVAPSAGLITGFVDDGFSVGATDPVNGDGDTIYWYAYKAGDFRVPIPARTSRY